MKIQILVVVAFWITFFFVSGKEFRGHKQNTAKKLNESKSKYKIKNVFNGIQKKKEQLPNRNPKNFNDDRFCCNFFRFSAYILFNLMFRYRCNKKKKFGCCCCWYLLVLLLVDVFGKSTNWNLQIERTARFFFYPVYILFYSLILLHDYFHFTFFLSRTHSALNWRQVTEKKITFFFYFCCWCAAAASSSPLHTTNKYIRENE